MQRECRMAQHNRSVVFRLLLWAGIFGGLCLGVGLADHHFPPVSAALTLEVVDSTGNTVENASCQVRFLRSYGHDYDLVKGLTDLNGHCFVKGKTYGETVIQVRKNGYDPTYASYVFERNPGMADDVQLIARYNYKTPFPLFLSGFVVFHPHTFCAHPWE